MEKPFVVHSPIHKSNQKNSVEEAAEDILENSIQRPQRHGERADTFDLEDMMKQDEPEEYEDDDKELQLPPFGTSEKTKQKMAKEMGEAEFEEMQGDLLNAGRNKQNVDEISGTIMDLIDAVDAGENKKIKTIMIEIGLE